MKQYISFLGYVEAEHARRGSYSEPRNSGIGVSEVESGAVMWLTGLNTTLLNTPKAM